MKKYNYLDNENTLTVSGQCALKIQEVNSFVMCDLLKLTNNFQSLTSCEIVSVMSCFITLTIPEKNKCYNPEGISKNLESILKEIDAII